MIGVSCESDTLDEGCAVGWRESVRLDWVARRYQ